MINIDNLGKSYNAVKVLDIEQLEIPQGQSFGLVGNNGAGKTTLFRLILDLIEADRGQVLSKDIAVNKDSQWKKYTGSFLDEGFLIDFLKPEEYFKFIADINGVTKEELKVYYNDFSDFFGDEILNKNKYIRDFSKGNQKKIGIFGAIISQPEVLILDEPFANLDPSSQIRLKTILNELHKKNNLTMLISSHDLNHIAEVSQRIVVLEKGQVVKDLLASSNTLGELEGYFNPATSVEVES
ncbi:ABC transporter ATP-binding protein [Labilibaculum sp. DW002]|uniref:ABC transporter ATP-binding protein n=1 Tax=Paralabilibaculum antarcticum TaxID=2912572 RepID=A0ABT5VX29_9BACT|nr:ABC transporter ATP-binding protein [Labilibaculum sp. DW002]MDE5419979.1 ABC transporter ATP-binding protein [Labilibaculum sp. DW002]